MGLSCSREITDRLGLTEKMKDQNTRMVYLCNQEGEEMSSGAMRGVPEVKPVLTAETREIILASWEIIKKDIERVGVVMFMG
ncbi:neuroglobin, partial [Biomphalaria pfeifferi]